MKTVSFVTFYHVEVYRTDGTSEVFNYDNARDVFVAASVAHSLGCTTKCTAMRVPIPTKPFDWDEYDRDVSLSDLVELDDDLPW